MQLVFCIAWARTRRQTIENDYPISSAIRCSETKMHGPTLEWVPICRFVEQPIHTITIFLFFAKTKTAIRTHMDGKRGSARASRFSCGHFLNHFVSQYMVFRIHYLCDSRAKLCHLIFIIVHGNWFVSNFCLNIHYVIWITDSLKLHYRKPIMGQWIFFVTKILLCSFVSHQYFNCWKKQGKIENWIDKS